MRRSGYVPATLFLAISAYGFGFKLQSPYSAKFSLALTACMLMIGAMMCIQRAFNGGLIKPRDVSLGSFSMTALADAPLLVPLSVALASMWAGFSSPIELTIPVAAAVLAGTAAIALLTIRFTKGVTP